MLRSLILSAALFATPAFAGYVPSEAQFTAGTSTPHRIIVNETIWHCDGVQCFGKNETRASMVRKACKTLAGEVGVLSALTIGTKALNAAELATCNEKARGTD